jgi:hypothetical protein
MLVLPGCISVERYDEGWTDGIQSSFHGRPSELVLLDLEGSGVRPRPFVIC